MKHGNDTGWLDRSDGWVLRYDQYAMVVLRGGLGLTIILAGVHKLVAPAVWHAYLAEPFVTVWPSGVLALSPTFVLFGISEVVFGIALLLDWHTPTVAAVTALSLLGVVVNLGVGVAVDESVIDVLIRDIGLTAFALGVALSATDGDDAINTGSDTEKSP